MKHLLTVLFLLCTANLLLAQASDKSAMELADIKPMVVFKLDAEVQSHPKYASLENNDAYLLIPQSDKVLVGFIGKDGLQGLQPDDIAAISVYKDSSVPAALADYGQDGVIEIQLKSKEAFWALLEDK